MSKVDELIRGLCPDGVERVQLGDLGSFKRGKGVKKDHLGSSGVPVVHYGQIYTDYGVWTEETVSFIEEGLVKKPVEASPGDLLITISDVTPTNVGKTVAWVGTENVVAGGDMLVFRHEQDPKYLSYVFQSDIFQKQKMSRVTGGTVRHLSAGGLSTISVPLPPLEVQKEIVRILDQFVELDRELEQEIARREEQLEFVRGVLLEAEVPTVDLKEIAELGTGSRNTSDAVESGEYAFYTRGEEVLALDEYDFEDTSIITAGDGVGVGKTMHFVSGKYALHQRAYRIHVMDKNYNSRFIYHLMKQKFLEYMERNSVHASVTSIRKWMLESFPVPRIPFEVQQEIANKLDTFTEYIDNLKRERELRQKQYEYYRDLLLDFPVKE